ncbi:MAG: CHAT domain-containing protein, partial [Anaerolineae bacterium]
MPIDVASILLSALAQIAGEYGVAVPLAGVARRILDDKARRAAFTEAVQAAYADLKASVHGDVAQALLDPHYLSRPAVAQELLGAVLIAGAVDYDHLQQLYVRSTGFDHIHVRPALRYLVERTRKHAADRHPWFQQWYGLELDQQQLQTQQQIAAILERIEEALTEREEAPAPEPEPEPQPALRVLVLLSAPLVDGKGNPVARLDLAQERALIETVLRESGADIQVRFRHATAEALRDGVRDGYDVVHFSGHGDLSVLAFEDEHGQLHTIDRGLLARLVRVGDQAARLVVLNACHSESLAEDLTAAGVAHVVAVERDEPVIDEAAIAFARDFYHALARGFTLEAAFEEGRDAVASAADLGVRAVAEEVKFRLLPGDRDHDAPLAEEGEGRGGYVEEGRLTAPINLPTPLDIFVGREREMWEINRQLSQGRLVTLTGTGGVGKTELARETARWHQARGRFPDGVFVVELEEARGPAAILTQIATTLRLERAESAEDVAKTLGRRQMLLVLDNLDDALHADLRGARELLETLVTRTEAPRFLVTSRQPVGRPRWENVYHVERLRIPADWKLFTDLSVNVGYRWHPGDEAALDEVLHFLDGLPLAIVLTAAQLSETNLAQLWDELERARTAALNEPGLTPEERGRLTSVDFSLTLSYNRLSAEAQRLFAAFSVFAGGADEGALDAVWGDAGWHEPIRALRRFSLVDEYHGRYSMLNPVREFAAGRLAELPDAPYHARMARHYQKIAAMCDADIGGVHSLTAVNLMALELVNIHAGMDWAVAAAEAGQILDDRPAWEFLPSRLQRWLQALDGRALDGG